MVKRDEVTFENDHEEFLRQLESDDAFRIDVEKAFIQEMIKIASDPKLIDDAIVERGSLRRGKKETTLSDYYTNPEEITLDRVGVENLVNIFSKDLLNKMQNIDRIVLEGIRFAAQNKVEQELQDKYLQGYGYQNQRAFVEAYGTTDIDQINRLDNISRGFDEIKKRILFPAVEKVARKIQQFKVETKEITNEKNPRKEVSELNAEQTNASKAYTTTATPETMKGLQSIQDRVLTREFAVQDKLNTIQEQASKIPESYRQLSSERRFKMHAHDKQFQELTNKIDNIYNDKSLSTEKKLQAVTRLLENEYNKKFDVFKSSSPLSKLIRTSRSTTPNDFINHLNDKAQAKDHHYTRMVGLLLNEAYQASPNKEDRNKLTDLIIPNNAAYQNVFSDRKIKNVQQEAHVSTPKLKP